MKRGTVHKYAQNTIMLHTERYFCLYLISVEISPYTQNCLFTDV